MSNNYDGARVLVADGSVLVRRTVTRRQVRSSETAPGSGNAVRAAERDGVRPVVALSAGRPVTMRRFGEGND